MCAKDNQEKLKKEIKEYVQDEAPRKFIEKRVETKKNRKRIENRTAFVTSEIGWMQEKVGGGEMNRCTEYRI